MERAVKEIEDIDEALARIERRRPEIRMDITFLKPLAAWYEWMTLEQKKNLPPRVINALDSLHMILRGRL